MIDILDPNEWIKKLRSCYGQGKKWLKNVETGWEVTEE